MKMLVQRVRGTASELQLTRGAGLRALARWGQSLGAALCANMMNPLLANWRSKHRLVEFLSDLLLTGNTNTFISFDFSLPEASHYRAFPVFLPFFFFLQTTSPTQLSRKHEITDTCVRITQL